MIIPGDLAWGEGMDLMGEEKKLHRDDDDEIVVDTLKDMFTDDSMMDGVGGDGGTHGDHHGGGSGGGGGANVVEEDVENMLSKLLDPTATPEDMKSMYRSYLKKQVRNDDKLYAYFCLFLLFFIY